MRRHTARAWSRFLLAVLALSTAVCRHTNEKTSEAEQARSGAVLAITRGDHTESLALFRKALRLSMKPQASAHKEKDTKRKKIQNRDRDSKSDAKSRVIWDHAVLFERIEPSPFAFQEGYRRIRKILPAGIEQATVFCWSDNPA